MKTKNSIEATITSGILIGHEIGEWAGFVSGKLTIKKKDGERADFHFGRESRGMIPKIGSLVEIEHTGSVLPKIDEIKIIDEREDALYKESADSFRSSLLLGKPNVIAVFAMIEVILGLCTILIGLMLGEGGPAKSLFFALCGLPHLIIGYLIWNYVGG
ncbi:MAG: hypothetical protein ACFFDM_10680 [Candidatus Thorarchaeota archaeon]